MKTVLIIDDDPVFLTRLGSALKAANYRVLKASDGDEAMHVLEQQHGDISLAVVDLVLPGTDGFQIIGTIGRHRGPMKVIATTGRLKETFLETCKYMGADAIVRKTRPDEPFPSESWLETVRSVLGAESSHATA